MIEEPPLLTIRRSNPRPTPEQIAAFQGIPSAIVSDCLFGTGALSANVAPLTPDMTAAGPALTVDCQPADILPLLGALKFIQTSDIVMSAFQGHQGCAAAGDRVSGMMKNAGAAGFVTDGPMRDIAGILEVGLPCWCTGLTPASPVTTGPGRIGYPIQIAGQHVASGDMVIADRDGVAIVPHARIDEVIARIPKVCDLENALDAEVRAGLSLPPDIDTLLASDKTAYED